MYTVLKDKPSDPQVSAVITAEKEQDTNSPEEGPAVTSPQRFREHGAHQLLPIRSVTKRRKTSSSTPVKEFGSRRVTG